MGAQTGSGASASEFETISASGAARTSRVPGGARSAKIYAALLDAILDHRLTLGTRLPEDDIGALFGVSRTIVRAALQTLALELQRAVTIQPNRGAQVAHPSIEEARQVFEARSLLEPRIAALAAEHATTRDVARQRTLPDAASPKLASRSEMLVPVMAR